VSGSQSSIRQLHDQVSVLEAEVARPKRRRLLPHAVLFAAAVMVGAASAGVARHDTAAPANRDAAHRASVHRVLAERPAAPRVAHLIDAPAERARALPVVHRHRAQTVSVRHRVVHPAAPAPSTHVAPVAAVVAAPAVEPAIAHRPAVAARHAAPAHRAAPARAPAKPSAARAHARPSAAPVGIGPVVVTTSEEPQPDADGTSPTTAP